MGGGQEGDSAFLGVLHIPDPCSCSCYVPIVCPARPISSCWPLLCFPATCTPLARIQYTATLSCPRLHFLFLRCLGPLFICCFLCMLHRQSLPSYYTLLHTWRSPLYSHCAFEACSPTAQAQLNVFPQPICPRPPNRLIFQNITPVSIRAI